MLSVMSYLWLGASTIWSNVYVIIRMIIFNQHSCCCSAAKSCPTLCNPMDCSTPCFRVFHCLLNLLKLMYVESVDAIQPSHPLLPASPAAFNLSHIRVFANESATHIRCPKYWSFRFSISPLNEYLELISFRVDWFESPS